MNQGTSMWWFSYLWIAEVVLRVIRAVEHPSPQPRPPVSYCIPLPPNLLAILLMNEGYIVLRR